MSRTPPRICISIPSFVRSARVRSTLADITDQIDIHQGPARPTTAELRDYLQTYDVLILGIKETITSELLSSVSLKTRIIGTLSIGTDHIDEEACAAHDIQVLNAPTGNVSAVAEHALALLLALRKRFPEGDGMVRTGRGRQGLDEWPREICGMHVGLVGAGKTALTFARLLSALGADISAWTFRPEAHPEMQQHGVTWAASLQELFATTEAVSLHMPLSAQTTDLIDHDLLSQTTRRPFILVNTSRAGLLARGALPQAIAAGAVTFAGLDLLREDESPDDYDPARVLLTPHIAGVTIESLERLSDELISRIAATLKADNDQESI